MRQTRNASMPMIRWGWLYFFCLASLFLPFQAEAQTSPAELTGMWKASVGKGPVMQGMWLAQISSTSLNVASGSWSLLTEVGGIALQGTWSARKTPQGWQGSWTARVGSGRSLSGTWSAGLGDFKGKTLSEMLILTMQRQIGGAWQSGRYQGDWWLESSGNTRRH